MIRSLALLTVYTAPLLTLAARARAQTPDGSYIDGIFDEIGAIVETAVPVLVGLALVLFLWGLVVFMTRAGEDQDKGKQHMLWGIIILFVAISVWGIIQVIRVMFGVDVEVAPDAPGIPTVGA